MGAKEAKAPEKRRKRLRGGCAACILRHIRCERRADRAACDGCVKKAIVCVSLFSTRALLQGPDDDVFEQLFTWDRARGVFSSDAETKLSPSSAAAALTDDQLRGCLISVVVNQSSPGLQMLKDLRLVESLETVSRRLDQLEPVRSALIAAVIAAGARISDHPLLVGNTGSRTPAVDGDSFSKLYLQGQTRTTACRELLKNAVAAIDNAGIMRRPSFEGLVAMWIVTGLISMEKNLEWKRTVTGAYVAASAHHIRSLLTDTRTPAFVRSAFSDGELGWSIIVMDATRATFDASGVPLTDDDIDLLTGGNVTPLKDALHEGDLASEVDPQESFSRLYRSTAYHMAISARQAARALTSVKATRDMRLNEAALWQFVMDMRLTSEALSQLERAAAAFVGEPGRLALHYSSDQNMLTWGAIRVLGVSRATQFTVLHVAASRKLIELQFASPSPASSMVPALQLLEGTTHHFAFNAARELARLLKQLLTTGLTLVSLPGIASFLTKAPTWALPLVDTLVAEEGGSAGFTFDEKLADLGNILQAARFVASSWDMRDSINWLGREISVVKTSQWQAVD